jgi:hypothetical protein
MRALFKKKFKQVEFHSNPLVTLSYPQDGCHIRKTPISLVRSLYNNIYTDFQFRRAKNKRLEFW